MISRPKEKTIKWCGRFFLLIISLMILFWSLVSAGFEKMMSDMRSNRLRNIPIEYVKEIGNGEKILKIYKVPESNIEPGDIRYSLKKFRDELWILLSRTPKEKAEVYLLMADKRMFEVVNLIKDKKSDDLILKTLDDSICNLEEAKKNLFEKNQKDVEFFKTNQQIDQAGLAYEDIVKSFNYKNEKVDKIINELENWNQKNREYNERN
ncbi:MAG: DUF5667 domain-containing protein [Candidatus Shapirobacteria bacterium]|nr:DUF5667 domain-containing protein [Candidatus Shapirobacteria bacterium]MDD4383034.1 DUF5667 domain-containing protein [Candidatus Shapirobacteria bacterium]